MRLIKTNGREFSISILIFLVVMTMLSCKTEKKNNSQSMNNTDFLKRTPSFSYVFIKGNHVDRVVSFLEEVDYKLLSRENQSGDYEKVYEDLEYISEDNKIVKKGIFYKDGFTVLIDPEMVIATLEEELVNLSRELDNKIVAAIWERYSQTRALIEISQTGLESSTYLTVGEDAIDNVNTNKHLEQNDTEVGLYRALGELTIPYKTLFGDNMKLDILTLKE